MTDNKLNSTDRLYRELVGKRTNQWIEQRKEFYRQQYEVREARRSAAGRIWPHLGATAKPEGK